MAGVQVLPALDGPEEVEELAEELEVISRQRHLPRERQLDAGPHEVAERVVLLVVVPLRVLEARLADEADVRPVHPRRGVRAGDVLVAVDDELHALRLVRQEERGDGAKAGLGVLAPRAVRVGDVAAVGDDGVVAEPAAEHARALVVALCVRRGGTEGPSEVAVRILTLGPGDVQGALLLQQRLQLLQLGERHRLFLAEL
mmetsp:Transcript_27736/g.78705  ORF Transcript_27736/g.78705 Transcript_27736/m.78705 type:complete len:200 (-) Transcript_27736:107-706(-)